jgi:hypothetical protein
MSDFGKGFLRMLGFRDGEAGTTSASEADTNVNADTDANAAVTNSDVSTQESMSRESLEALEDTLFDSMENESDFIKAYSTLKEDLQQELERQQMLCAEGVMESFSELWMQNRAISYVNQAEQAGSYYIPVTLGEELTTIHLTIQQEVSRRGTVEISFATEHFGTVEATLQVTVTEVTMYVNAEQDSLEAILQRLEQELGWIRANGDEMRELSADEVPETDILYQAAKVFIEQVKKIEEIL